MATQTADLSAIDLFKRREMVGDLALWGTVDDAAGPTPLYANTENLKGAKESRRSAIARASGVMGPGRMVGLTGGGPITVDVALGAQFDGFLEELCLAQYSADAGVNSIQISADDTDNSITDDSAGGLFDEIEAGQWIKMSGWTTPATGNNAEFYVSSKPTANKLILAYGTITTKIAGDTVVVTAKRLRLGQTVISATYERLHTDMATPEYQHYPGQVITQGEVTLGLQEIIQAVFTTVGFGPRDRTTSSVWSNAPSVGEAYVGNVTDKQNNVTGFRAGGVLYGQWRSFSFNLNNNVTTNPAGEGNDPYSVSIGDRILGGNMEAYLVGGDGRPAKALGHTAEDFHFRIANDAGDRIYTVTIHAAKTTDTGDTPKTAARGPVLFVTPWEADPWDQDPDVLMTITKLGL